MLGVEDTRSKGCVNLLMRYNCLYEYIEENAHSNWSHHLTLYCGVKYWLFLW